MKKREFLKTGTLAATGYAWACSTLTLSRMSISSTIATDIINLISGETEFRIVDSMIGIYSEVTTP